jgi:1-acyl-sn-glycerol-3-phosphate acyltransferase
MELIEGCGGRFHIRGIANLAASQEPVVFISNHMSTLETFVLPCLIEPYRDVTFVVKESLIKNPFFGPIMRSRDPVTVGREHPKEDFKIVMDKGRKILAGGRSIIIFPQSTRTTRFEPENFNTLGIKLAKAAGVKVIPIAIKTDFWANGNIVKDFGPIDRHKPIHITFGEPLGVEGSGKLEHQRTIDFIQEHLEQWSTHRS